MPARSEHRHPLAVDPDAYCLKSEAWLGNSHAVRSVRALLGKFALVDTPVLIRGESGTGKTLLAQALHQASPRHDRPFRVVRCGTVPAQHTQARLSGCFEAAEGGTLLFKDIDELALEAQACLMRVLYDTPLGQRPLPVHVRVLATCGADVVAAVVQGRLRKELFYRLNVLELVAPPLRDQREDLALLAEHFLQRDCHELNRRAHTFSESALTAMARYEWPGNVRELTARVRRGLVVATGRRIEARDLGLEASLQASEALDTLQVYKDRAEREALQDVLYRHGHNLSQAAAVLAVSRPTFYRLLHKHGLR